MVEVVYELVELCEVEVVGFLWVECEEVLEYFGFE